MATTNEEQGLAQCPARTKGPTICFSVPCYTGAFPITAQPVVTLTVSRAYDPSSYSRAQTCAIFPKGEGNTHITDGTRPVALFRILVARAVAVASDTVAAHPVTSTGLAKFDGTSLGAHPIEIGWLAYTDPGPVQSIET